jgi:hypothetical protein
MKRRTFLIASNGALLHKAYSADSGNVIVQAGRRIDAPGAPARFPEANIALVRQRIKELFLLQKPGVLVSAAACGSDLLALEVAEELNVRRVVLLPSPPETFRRTSVVDRPGDWGSRFDKLAREVRLEVVSDAHGQESYLDANLKLLDRAEALAKQRSTTAIALVVWNGKSRGPDDVTEHFLKNAQARKLRVIEVPTL